MLRSGRGIGRTARRILIGIVALGICLVGAGLIANNRPHEQPTPVELKASLDHALDWVTAHDAELLRDPNPAPWLMLAAANERLVVVSRLETILGQYRQRWLMGSMSNSLWKRMFDSNADRAFFTDDVASLAPYQKLFAYGL